MTWTMWPARLLLDPRLSDKDCLRQRSEPALARHPMHSGHGSLLAHAAIPFPFAAMSRIHVQESVIFRCLWHVFLAVIGLLMLVVSLAGFGEVSAPVSLGVAAPRHSTLKSLGDSMDKWQVFYCLSCQIWKATAGRQSCSSIRVLAILATEFHGPWTPKVCWGFGGCRGRLERADARHGWGSGRALPLDHNVEAAFVF